MSNWTTSNIPSVDGKRVVITGGNSGIGLGTATELARKGADLIIAIRDLNKGAEAVRFITKQVPNAKVAMVHLDLSNLTSVRTCARQLKTDYDCIDILINNAGVMMFKDRLLSPQGYEMQLATNHFGHFVFTHELLPLLESSEQGRIVVISSLVTNMKAAAIYFDDINFNKSYDPMKAYAQSKLANLMFILDLANLLKERQSKILVVGAHPGYTATNLQRHMGLLGTVMNALMAQSINMGILPSLRAATDPNASSGDYFGPNKLAGYRGYPELAKMTDLAHDADNRSKLWQLTELCTETRFGH